MLLLTLFCFWLSWFFAFHFRVLSPLLTLFAFHFHGFSPLTFAFFRIWLSRFFAFNRVFSHLTFAFSRLYLRYFAYDFCVFSPLFALFRIWLSRFFAFDFCGFFCLWLLRFFFAYISVIWHLTFAFFPPLFAFYLILLCYYAFIGVKTPLMSALLRILIPTLTFTELRVVSMEHLQRVWHASRERIPFRTHGSVPHFGTCECSNCWDQIPRTCHGFTRLFTSNTPWYFLDIAYSRYNAFQFGVITPLFAFLSLFLRYNAFGLIFFLGVTLLSFRKYGCLQVS